MTTSALAVMASPVSPRSVIEHVQHEKRSTRSNWSKYIRLPRSYSLPVRIGLTQRNLDKANEFVSEIADPRSPSYGRHWSREKIIDTFAPEETTIDAVLAWLEDEGIDRNRTTVSRARNWISFTATRDEVEALLEAEYHIFTHHESGHAHVACDGYSVPKHLAQHIDIITPTVHFDQRLGDSHDGVKIPLSEEKLERLRKRVPISTDLLHPAEGIRPGITAILGDPASGSLPKPGKIVKHPSVLASLMDCDTMITPACIRALYGMPPGTLQWPANGLGIVEYTPQSFLQEDLNLFFEQYEPRLVGKSPIVHLIADAVLQTEKQSYFYNGESSLDLEFAMSLIYPQRVTLYQVGDTVQGGSFNNFLDAIDGSYCNFQGGGSKDPNIDGQYPQERVCGTAPLVNVISTSYAYNEGDLSVRYEERQCAEYMKLALQGVSMVFASGDFGVAGNKNQCFDPLTGAYQHGSLGGIFNPSFPSTCPWVTSVGATEVMEGSTVRSGEVACEKVIRSGGGFSNVFPMPEYQRKAVEEYHREAGSLYGSDRYNNSRTTRGYPDVSANGANFVTGVNGNFTLSYGTSASAPVFAAMLTLINEKRLAAGKSTVGFVNPVLYANPGVFNDIRFGRNPGCSTDGFSAREGWDPVTGLGTPRYRDLESLLMGLP
ncbi:Tripeptidyl-peptidase sed1 [Scedosporium apiospermum]|uniref:tripeptidyl-peptidase II n=1 Tax=Pseudallescheria apiosperma TaxID=563466 RepID=A0A084FW40_PSEDA|nr:Tripeptidyl-peptidase sed1 [Scedosporium apiospermum]KEZ39302.1 Tripeptidyl-peptidase sed1 [Scedosporium apiospermum]